MFFFLLLGPLDFLDSLDFLVLLDLLDPLDSLDLLVPLAGQGITPHP